MRKTKIICSMGPATESPEIIKELMLNGMDCARFNFSHGTHESHKKHMDTVKAVRKELNLNIPILLDTKGPEIRLKNFKEGKVCVKDGQIFTLSVGDNDGCENCACVTFDELYRNVSNGTSILIDDGAVALKVERIDGTDIVCRVINGGVLKNHKGINVPDTFIDMPYLSEADKSDLLFGIEQDVDFVAASFVRCADDVITLRKFLNENGGQRIQIISKIENRSGVENLKEIIEASDGVMVARGDLGVEISFDELPAIQKKLISACYWQGKHVVTATQMLESMTNNPRPTRAEVSDVANAVYDGTTAIMLSGETAAGQYPIEALKTMAEIASTTESNIHYKKRFMTNELELSNDIPNAVSNCACLASYSLNVEAIIAVTRSGRTARLVSAYRPACKIIAPCTDERTCRQLNLRWGVRPVLSIQQDNTDKIMEHAVEKALETGLVKKGDLTVIVGAVIGQPHMDMLRLYEI